MKYWPIAVGGIFLSMFLLAGTVAATPIVAGEVVDGNGNPVSGAAVTAICDGDSRGPVDTLDDGTYAIDFAGSASCGIGDTVDVTATKDGKSGSNSGTVNDWTWIEIAIVNIELSIPEFPTVAIPAVLTLGGYLALFRRRKMW